MKHLNYVVDKEKIREYLDFLLQVDNKQYFHSPIQRDYYLKASVYRYALIIEMLKKHVSESSLVLDVGIHPYSFALLLKNVLNCKIVGIGKAHSLLRGFKEDKRFSVERKYGISTYRLNVEKDKFPMQDDTFDAVIFAAIIEHLLFSPSHALAEIHKVMKKDGVLIITTPNALSWRKLYDFIKRRNIYDRLSLDDIYGRHNREYTKNELITLLRSCNYKINEIFTCSFYVRKPSFFLKIIHLFGGLNEQIFIKASPIGKPAEGYPREIYRSSLP